MASAFIITWWLGAISRTDGGGLCRIRHSRRGVAQVRGRKRCGIRLALIRFLVDGHEIMCKVAGAVPASFAPILNHTGSRRVEVC